MLRALDVRLTAWQDGDRPVRATTASACATLGRRRARRAARRGDPLEGTAVDVDDDGRLVVEADDGSRTAVAAGDVVHVR